MNVSERGFTLVELLVAIVILAATTLIVTEALRMVAPRISRQESRLEAASRIASVDEFLRSELADARPFPASPAAVAFDGAADRLTFVSWAPESIAAGGLLMLSLSVVRTTNVGAALRLAWHPFPTDRLTQGSGSDKALLDRLGEARFSYFGETGNIDAPEWQDSWSGMRALPLLVRLRMTLSNGETLPDLVIAPRLSPGSGDLQNARRRF